VLDDPALACVNRVALETERLLEEVDRRMGVFVVERRDDHRHILPYLQYLCACKQLLHRRKQLIRSSRVSLARSSAS
jgi:hypothetical protein